MLEKSDLLALSNANFDDVKKQELIDIDTISLHEKTTNKRFLEYLKQIGNPYCYRCGDIGVKVEFDDTMPYLEPKLIEFLVKKKQG